MKPETPNHPTPKVLLWMSVLVASSTIVLKTLAWYLTGSVSLLSDAMESFVNLAGAVFALVMVTIAQQPPDDKHPYGHSKAEYFSSGFEGILIIGAALAMLWVSVQRLWHPHPLEQLSWGIALSMISTVFNAWLAWVMFRAARQHHSVALLADARHLITDVWTSVGVVLGLLGVWFTGWLWLDAFVGIVIALNILREGAHLLWDASQGLMDEAADAEMLGDIDAVLDRFIQHGHAQDLMHHAVSDDVHGKAPQALSTLPSPSPSTIPLVRFDHLITRKAGQKLFVDLHMHVPGFWSLSQAAILRAKVEAALMDIRPGLQASIQLLPFDVETVHQQGQGEGRDGRDGG